MKRFLRLPHAALFLFGVVVPISAAHAQSTSLPKDFATPDPSVASPSTAADKQAMTQALIKQAGLTGILDGIGKLETELRNRQDELRSPAGQGRQQEITQQIQEIGEKLEQLHHNFTEIASGVDPDVFAAKNDLADVDWSKDLREILSPLINEVRRLTSRPREMDRLKTSVEEEEGQLVLIDQGKASVAHQMTETSDPRVSAELAALHDDFESKKQNISTQLNIARQKLDRRLDEQGSIGESVHNIFQLFFKSRGLNLVIAMVTAFLFWLVARRLHRFTGRYLNSGRITERGFYERLISVLLMLATAFGAIIVFLVTLYFVGDWVLLILALMLILGVIWTSKQAVHQFWNHAAMLLNMGSCREGERIVYNNLPWELRSLSLYCNLVNPALSGGDILLPIRDLAMLRSRSYEPEERWFPTSVGDVVLLEAEQIGKIELQSIESVRIRLNGGMDVEIPTDKFLELHPQNLSSGFRHRIIFTFDYRHQQDILDVIPKALEAQIKEVLSREEFLEYLLNLDIEFEQAASSSLNLEVEADFNGVAATKYKECRRAIAAAFIEACNKNDWVIPFSQMTVHLHNSGEARR